MEKILKIYTYVDGENDKAFPSDDAQIEIYSFSYSASRMGGAPSISTSVMYKDCLDKLWTGNEYVIYNNERYKLKQTPTSSKTNTDARYKHDLELVALRIVLDYVYFFDAVSGNTPVDDKPITNSTKVAFSGDIHEFAKRLNASLKYTKLDYSVIVDDGITSETKFLSFDAQPISSVLQEIHKQYETPYYFDGNVIHIGFTSNAITTPFEYGVNDALLSISKNNANNKIVNRCTGVGSSDNIPYYYPNEHPLGEVNVLYNKEKNNALISNSKVFAEKVKLNTKLTYSKNEEYSIRLGSKDLVYNYPTAATLLDEYYLQLNSIFIYLGLNSSTSNMRQHWFAYPCLLFSDSVFYSKYFAENSKNYEYELKSDITGLLSGKEKNRLTEALTITYGDSYTDDCVSIIKKIDRVKYAGKTITPTVVFDENKTTANIKSVRYYIADNDKKWVRFKLVTEVVVDEMIDDYLFCVISATATRETKLAYYSLELKLDTPLLSYEWKDENGSVRQLHQFGLSCSATPQLGDAIEFEQVVGSKIPYQENLMPTIYRTSKGAEMFYNAYNQTYVSPETGKHYEFSNEYDDANRREHKEEFDYIKPSIEFVKNGENKPINMFLEFAYNETDSDEVDEAGNYLHPYFFAKLRKFNGDNGFNLFDHANEKGEMTISMTSGNCGACNFVIGVQEDTKKNIVQVNKDGSLARDEYGNVRFGEAQDEQNDTINNEVWIALKKDASTFNDIMPNAVHKYRPKACTNTDTNDGDTFVITNISLPTAYIREAEERLKDEIIKYMSLNNSEKFTFSIKFSRIYLAENPNILAQLNENARIQIIYNESTYELYVSSFQYRVVNNEPLPEITVELSDTLVRGENAIRQALNDVEHSIMSSVGSIDFYKQGLRHFIRKDVDDFVNGLIHFKKGATFGANHVASIDENGNTEFVSQIVHRFIQSPLFIDGFAGQGFGIWLDENGKSNLTVDNITARDAFRVFEMLITKLRAVNGGLFVSAANGTIKSVESDGGNYIITLEQEHAFEAGDFMRSQTMSGGIISSYWVEISSVKGRDVIVKKSEFNDSLPYKGQDVVLCGSKNGGRQNAIHISATDDNQPRIEVLNGIKIKSLDNCLRTRLGDLSGIKDSHFGDGVIKGDGLYSDNAYLKGEFIVKNTGESVETMFAVRDGKIQNAVAQTQGEAIKGKTLLYNASFTKGFDGWETSNDAEIYVDEQGIIVNDNKALQQSVTISDNAIFDNVFCMQINNGWIKQQNWMFINKPDFEINKTYPLFFSTNIKCAKAGELIVKVKDETIYTKQIEPTDDFISIDVDGLEWDGSGDFYLSFTGIAEFYGLTIYSEKTEVKYATLFEQNERLIQLSAAIYEKNEEGLKVLQESGIAVQSEGAGLYARKSDGSQALIAAYIDDSDETKILLSGDKIRLEGDISLNGKVRIDVQTGTLYAEDGSFSGKITSEEGNIGGFEISSGDLMAKSITSEDDYHTMMLSANNIHFKKYEYFDASYGGTDIIYETNINARLGNNTIASTTGNFVCPLKIDVASNNQSNVNLGMYIDVTGARRSDNSIMTGNHALYIPSGDICGFRLKTRRINNSETLNKMDSLIIVTQSGITVTLPNDAEEGQMYIVKKLWGLGSYTISAQGDDKLWIYASGTKTSQLIESSIVVVLYYDAANKAWCGGQIAYI